jgi:hypothetical protein
MKARFWILCGALLTACTAGTVKTDVPQTSRDDHAGQQFGGVTNYADPGIFSVRYAGREDTREKMHRHCGGPYEIVGYVAQRGGCLQPAQQRILFKCVDGGKVAAR